MAREGNKIIDVLDGFILHSSLSFSENVVLNYARKHKIKEDVFGYARNFFGNNQTRTAWNNLLSYGIISETEKGFKVNKDFAADVVPNIEKLSIRFGSGRPIKYHITK